MSRSLVVVALLFSAAPLCAQESPPALNTLKDKVSYLVGMNIGRQLKNDDMEIDQELLIRGLRDAIAGAKAPMTEDEMEATFREFQKAMMAKEAAKALEANPELKAVADKNSAEGTAFLADNGKKEGVVTLPSGLQYKVITPGTGPTPKATDSVKTHYRGRLINGTVFDSSYDRGEPASFGVTQVIGGWTEALQKMKVGDKWELYIPANLAYGLRGSPPAIGPNSTLLFEIELLGIEPSAEPIK